MTRAESKERTRQRLLAEAQRLFRERGYAATSLEQIAEAAEVTKGAIYGHFASKEDLLLGAIEAGRDTTPEYVTMLNDESRPLRERLADDAARRGVALPEGRILLLTHLRYLGYCFNPVSFFYCFDADDHLQLVLAEVNNTFGGSQTYWVRPHDRAPKSLYVSPFLQMDLEYVFDFATPGESLVAHMETRNAGGTLLDATLRLDRRAWSAREIRRALVRHPVMTVSVIAGIHREALRLWWKGVPIVPRPSPDGTIEERRTTDGEVANDYAEQIR